MKLQLLILVFLLMDILSFSQELKKVNTPVLNVRNGAGVEFEIIDQLHKGDTVKTFSTVDNWTEIVTKNGSKGYVSVNFLSTFENKLTNDASKSTKSDSWFIYLFFGVAGLILLNTAKKTLFRRSSSNVNLNSKRKTPGSQNSSNAIRRNAVYRFRIKSGGIAGGLKYVEGMNVEVAVSGLGSSGSPFNTSVQKLFILEFARKYNVEPRNYSSIEMLFKPDLIDVELI